MPRVEDLEERIKSLIIAKINGQPFAIPEFPISKYFKTMDDSNYEAIVDIFEWRYQYWILQFAERLSEDANGGFAVLVLLNAYFDMIAQLHGHKWGEIEEGLKLVFPELESEPKVTKYLKKHLREAIAHMGITTNIILKEDFSDPIVWGPYRGEPMVIVISPRLMFVHIKSHFEKYTASLRDPSAKNDDKRRKFLKRIRKKATL
jgi:hypothetical protein